MHKAVAIKPGPLWPVIIFRAYPKMLLSFVLRALFIALVAAAERKKPSANQYKQSSELEPHRFNKDLREFLCEQKVENPTSYMLSYIRQTGIPSLYRNDGKDFGPINTKDDLVAIIKTL